MSTQSLTLAGNCLQHLFIVADALATLRDSSEAMETQKRAQYNYCVDQFSQSYAVLQCLRDSLQQLDDITVPRKLTISLKEGEVMPTVPDMSLSSPVALPDQSSEESVEKPPVSIVKASHSSSTSESRKEKNPHKLGVEEESGKSSDLSTESESESGRSPVLPAAMRGKSGLVRSATTGTGTGSGSGTGTPRTDDDDGTLTSLPLPSYPIALFSSCPLALLPYCPITLLPYCPIASNLPFLL